MRKRIHSTKREHFDGGPREKFLIMTAMGASSTQINFHCWHNYVVSKDVLFSGNVKKNWESFSLSPTLLPQEWRWAVSKEKGRLPAPGDFFMKRNLIHNKSGRFREDEGQKISLIKSE